MAAKHMEHIQPYSPQAGTMIPTKFRKFLRTCVIWQFIRFIAINIKMTLLILKRPPLIYVPQGTYETLQISFLKLLSHPTNKIISVYFRLFKTISG